MFFLAWLGGCASRVSSGRNVTPGATVAGPRSLLEVRPGARRRVTVARNAAATNAAAACATVVGGDSLLVFFLNAFAGCASRVCTGRNVTPGATTAGGASLSVDSFGRLDAASLTVTGANGPVVTVAASVAGGWSLLSACGLLTDRVSLTSGGANVTDGLTAAGGLHRYDVRRGCFGWTVSATTTGLNVTAGETAAGGCSA